MLTEIKCDLFEYKGKPRGPIHFKSGLNIILGSGTGVNSVGKSTMLLIIDYAFGGTAYSRSDAVRELDNHLISFTFTFDKNEYYFHRNTESVEEVFQTDSSGKLLQTLSREEFVIWLKSKYDIDLPDLKFRNTISRFFRIYGKKNYEETQPLQDKGQNESATKAIDVLLRLFDQYKDIKPFIDQYENADSKAKAFRAARKYDFIPSSIDKVKKYEENIEVIADLKKQLKALKESNNQEIKREDLEKAEKTSILSVELSDLRREIKKKEDDLHLLELNLSQGIYPSEADLVSLRTFFPEANIKEILEIERFHSKIFLILKEELEIEKSNVESELVPLKESEKKLLAEIDSIRPSALFNQEFLEAYTSLDRRIHRLENENEAYLEDKRLQSIRSSAKERRDNQIAGSLKIIQDLINKQMEINNDILTTALDYSPVLTFKTASSYDFSTPKDDGTGTNFRGMLIYDLSILQLTVLPAIAHDSMLFSDIDIRIVARLLKLYAQQTDKQIFIAFDKDVYHDEETKQLIQENVVLQLGDDEEALFGYKWGRKAKKNEN